MINTRKIGNDAEKRALIYLEQKGYTLIKKNFYAHRRGEIDLICETDSCIIFVEVKYSKYLSINELIEKIDTKKQRRLYQTAEAFLSTYSTEKSCRFDAICLNATELYHIENAFWG